MTKRQLKSSVWFLVLTVVLALLSVFFAKEVQQAEDFITEIEARFSDLGPTSSASPIPTPTSTISTAISATSSTKSASLELVLVTKVIDGDTIQIETGKKVRYIGIDTPELHHPQKGQECFAMQAFEENKKWVEGKRVRLEKDVSETDRYGRLLRYVWVDDVFINETLVKQGYAYASSYPPDIKMQNIIKIAQTQAQQDKVGLWSECSLQ